MGVIERGASEATAWAAPWVERMARIGYASKAVLYGTIGLLALSAATGREVAGHSGATDQRGAMRTVLDLPFGRTLLGFIAAGLVGYALWRLIEAVADPERRGHDAKGLAIRGSLVARAALHLALALSALRLAVGTGGGGSSAKRSQGWSARALEAPGGRWLLLAVALAIVGYGLYQLWRATTDRVVRRLDLGSLPAPTKRWVTGVSRFGVAARGVVFGMIGVLLARAAVHRAPGEAGGIAESLRAFGRMGAWPLALVATGLVAYAAYELLEARYRRIRAA